MNIIRGIDRISIVVSIICSLIFSGLLLNDCSKTEEPQKTGITSEFRKFIKEKYKKEIPINTTNLSTHYEYLTEKDIKLDFEPLFENDPDNYLNWDKTLINEFKKHNPEKQVFVYEKNYKIKLFFKNVGLVFLFLIISVLFFKLIIRLLIFTISWVLKGFKEE